jgi:hypothetical protein
MAAVVKLRKHADELERRLEQQQEMMQNGHRDLVGCQLQIVPLQAAVDALLHDADLDVATSAEALGRRVKSVLQQLQAATLQAQPDKDSSIIPLELLDSAILRPSHTTDMSRFFKDISLVSQQVTRVSATQRASGRSITQHPSRFAF